LGGIAADTLISIFKNDFSFFEKQAERIEEAPSQQAIQQLLLNYEDLFDAYEEFTMSFKEDFDYVENKLKKFDLERVINLLLQLQQENNLTKEVTIKAVKYVEKYIEMQIKIQAFGQIAEALSKLFENIDKLIELAEEKFQELLQNPSQENQDQDGQKKDTKPTGPVSREIDNVLSEPS
jgi:hypothetical protein